jgi:hypothetical protein
MTDKDTNALLNTSDRHDKLVTQPPPKKNSKLGVIFLIIALLVGAAVAGYFLFTKKTLEKSYAAAETFDDKPCILTIKDSHKPVLEMTFAASNSESVLSEEKAKEIEGLVVDSYNVASGGCSDEFKRWMYGINVIDQAIVEHAVLEDEAESSSISHTFDNEYNLVLRLETMISCENCGEDEAFASVYPATFGSRPSARHLNVLKFSSSAVYTQIEKALEGRPDVSKLLKMNLIATLADSTQVQHASYYEETASVSTNV